MLFSTFMQKMEYVGRLIKILVVIQKRVHRAIKTTWLCLCFDVTRALSRSRLVMNKYTFQCVSPHFRQESENTDIDNYYSFFNHLMGIMLLNEEKIYRTNKLSIYTLVSNIIKLFITVKEHECEHNMFISAFIMIKPYMFPNG